MAVINFDFNSVYDCAARIRGLAELVEQEAKKVTSIIGTVETGWTGTGSAAYINYLESLRTNIFERSQRLYSIANALEGSAFAAEEADKEAARQLAAAEAISACPSPAPPAASESTPAVCEPPKQEQLSADAISNVFNDQVNTVKSALKSSSKKGKAR